MGKIKDALQQAPGFALFAIAAKEINLIKTQRIALALILLYPVIVIVTLGAAFSGNIGINNADVAFYSPREIAGFDPANFTEKLRQSGNVNLVMSESEGGVLELVKKRKVKLGIVVREPEPTTGRFVVDIYSDNSNLFSAEFFFQVANASVRRVGFETSRELLADIWTSLSTIKESLKSETGRIDSFVQQLEETEAQILDLNSSLNELDIGEMRAKLNEQQQLIDELDPKITEFSDRIVTFDTFAQNEIGNISEMRAKIASYREQVNETHGQILIVKEELDTQQEVIAKYPTLQNAYDRLATTEEALANADTELAGIEGDLGNAESSLGGIRGMLADTSTDLADIKENLSRTTNDIEYFDSQLSVFGDTVDKMNGLIEESIATKQKVRSDLDQSKAMMEGFIAKLDGLQVLSPDFLSNPVIINKVKVYSATNLEIITPIALVLLLLLTTILLTGVSFVVERTEGSYSRLLLSSTGKITLFAGKALGQLAFALVESAIIIAIAMVGFKVALVAPMIDIALGISVVGLAFVSLGLFISNYTRIQSTTILSGLIVVIPMMFLSGIIIPVELMSPQIQQIGSVTPLSVGTLLMTEILVKGTPFIAQGTEIAKLLGSALVFFAFTLLNRNL